MKLFCSGFLLLFFSFSVSAVGICHSAFDLRTKVANAVASTSRTKVVYEINKMTASELQNMSPQNIPNILPESFGLMSREQAQGLRLVQLERVTPEQVGFIDLSLLTSIQSRTVLSPVRLWIGSLNTQDVKTISTVDIKDVFNDLTVEQRIELTTEQWNGLLPIQREFMLKHVGQLNRELQSEIASQVTAEQIDQMAPAELRAFANQFNWSEAQKTEKRTFNNIVRGLSVENRVQLLDSSIIQRLYARTQRKLARDISVEQFQQLTDIDIIIRIFESAPSEKQRELAPHLTAEVISSIFFPHILLRDFANDLNWTEVQKVQTSNINSIFKGLSAENRQRLNKDVLLRLDLSDRDIYKAMVNDITANQFRQLVDVTFSEMIRIDLFEAMSVERKKEFVPHLTTGEINRLLVEGKITELLGNSITMDQFRQLKDKVLKANIFEAMSVERKKEFAPHLTASEIKELWSRNNRNNPEIMELLANSITEGQFRQLVDVTFSEMIRTELFKAMSVERRKEFAPYLTASEIVGLWVGNQDKITELLPNSITLDQFRQLLNYDQFTMTNVFGSMSAGRQKEFVPHLTTGEIVGLWALTKIENKNKIIKLLANNITADQFIQLADVQSGKSTREDLFEAMSAGRQKEFVLHLTAGEIRHLWVRDRITELVANNITMDQFRQLKDKVVKAYLFEAMSVERRKEFAPHLPAAVLEHMLGSNDILRTFANDFNLAEIRRVNQSTVFNIIFEGLSPENAEKLLESNSYLVNRLYEDNKARLEQPPGH